MLALGSARQGWVQGGDSSGCGADRACVNLGGHGDAGRREALSPGGLDRPQRFPLVCLRNSPGGISRQHGAQSQGVSAACPHLGALVWKCRGGCWAGLHAPWVSRFPAAHHRSSNLLSPAGERRRQSGRPRCPVLVLQPRGLRAEPLAELKVGGKSAAGTLQTEGVTWRGHPESRPLSRGFSTLWKSPRSPWASARVTEQALLSSQHL